MNNKDRAMLVAEKAHANQSYGIYPYIYHIKEVVEIIESIFTIKNKTTNGIIVAAILHDVLEDSDLSYNDIVKEFGEYVGDLVYCVTDKVGKNRNQIKIKTYGKIKNRYDAVLIKMCDRIANIKNSKKSNKKMFDCYKAEHVQFCEVLDIEQLSKEHAWIEEAFTMLKNVLFENEERVLK